MGEKGADVAEEGQAQQARSPYWCADINPASWIHIPDCKYGYPEPRPSLPPGQAGVVPYWCVHIPAAVACASNPNCVAAHLTSGNCCPNNAGVHLECCR